MNVKEYYNNLLINDPKFREFVKANEGKSYQQVAFENGIDPDALDSLSEKMQQAI